MTVQSNRPTSPNARLRTRVQRRFHAVRTLDRGALSAEFAVLLCVGAGMAFLLYKALASGGVAGFIVDIVKGIVKGLIGGIG
ncbi:DUF4244 domain-containing protein [Nocardioidaceae bacterium]|nr:DUF4244 domain-containing protein [Nocardioidaceae bacterium]